MSINPDKGCVGIILPVGAGAKPMKKYKVLWHGDCWGVSYVIAKSLAEARELAMTDVNLEWQANATDVTWGISNVEKVKKEAD